MNGVLSPIAIAQVVARNIVPLVGILAFHWSTGNVLLLYLLDTLLAMAVIIAGLMSSFSPPPEEGVGGKINAEAGYVLGGLFVAAFLGIPLGAPIGIMLAASDFSFRMAFYDSSLRTGALIQAVLALWSYVGLYRALRTHSPTQLKLRPRFALVFMRWVVVIMATYFIVEVLPPSEVVLLLLVVAYVAASIYAEIAPDRFLRAMPGGEDNLAPDATALGQPTNQHAARAIDRRKRR